jgi:Flp pilus assembly protein TadG
MTSEHANTISPDERGPSKVKPRRWGDGERGQVLVIVAIGMVTLVAMVGLVVDGGYAWGKQRDTQNAADASAKAGAVKLAENLAGKVPANVDSDVFDAVADTAAGNVVGLPAAYYTDMAGTLLDPTGAPATSTDDAAQVGDGFIPSGAAGVRAVTDQTFDTFLARVIGFNQLTTSADATAVAGYLASCEASAGCIVLPVTVPVTVMACDSQNDPAPVTDSDGDKILWTSPSDPLTVPLCKNGPGNVGWLDWTPQAGGTSELVDAILTPSNIYLKWPGWYYITSTGNINSASVEDAINTYAGDPVLIPQFDLTCDAPPTGPGVTDCPTGHVGGNGQNQWYHLAGMSTFRFCSDDPAKEMPECDIPGPKNFTQGAYIGGTDQATCDTGNGATSCLAGKFVQIVYDGEVQAAPGVNGPSSIVGIQLIE